MKHHDPIEDLELIDVIPAWASVSVIVITIVAVLMAAYLLWDIS